MGELLDLAIIGGGINGAALAELAAANGYRVALLEKTDFGAGVTSRSTRLIHGGLRYLEHGKIGLVRESLREREAMMEEFPHQVRPIPFLIPVYAQDTRSSWKIRIGLEAYSWIGHSRLVKKHRQLSAAEVLNLEPALEAHGLRSGFLYYDCQAVYPERLALDMALLAEEHGALVRNHTPVVALTRDRQAVTGVRVEDGEEYRARLVVNAAGPWVDHIRKLLGASERPLLTLINGAHLVTARFPGAPSHAIYHEASADRRPFFIVPWRGLWMIGTTETPYSGDPGATLPAPGEIDYLLRETNLLFPAASLNRQSLLYSYAGPRPLLHEVNANAQAISREHAIYDHEKEEGIPGMLTLVGGKLTTARSFAERALNEIAVKLKRDRAWRIPRPGLELNGIPPRLAEIYGRRASEVVALARRNPDLDQPVSAASPTLAAEIVHAVRREKARTLGDLMLRRTGLGFEPRLGRDCAREVARVAAPLLGWDQAAMETALADYERELERTLYQVPSP